MDIRTIVSIAAITALSAGISGTSLKAQTPSTQESGKRFAIVFYESDKGFGARTSAKADKYWSEWIAYIGGIQSKGVIDSALPAPLLPPSEGRTVDASGTAKFSPKTIQLSGLIVVKAASLQEAIELTKGCPAIASGGKVDVRELMADVPKMEAVR